jgi:hypothetical protein
LPFCIATTLLIIVGGLQATDENRTAGGACKQAG